VPTSRQSDPRARTYVIDHVKPGTRFERRIRVCHGTTGPVELQIYAGAAEIDGDSFRAVEGPRANELSGWISVDPAAVTVPAKGEVLVDATVDVRDDATGGDAAILVEAPAVARPDGVKVASRVGVRV